jgi:hypothetical protein
MLLSIGRDCRDHLSGGGLELVPGRRDGAVLMVMDVQKSSQARGSQSRTC